ncbi:hypothetical protein HZC21_02885 [Candidatus Peregrinibacteria bacterium]|nr:hypothetical protein [Candidatus Peregrinibacteria bacterium]
MVAVLKTDAAACDFGALDGASDISDDIDECYQSLDIDSGDLQRQLTNQWEYLGAVNTIREMSRALVASGIKNIRFSPENGSFRNADTLTLSIFDLERAKFEAFLQRVGIDVSEAYVFRGKPQTSQSDQLRESLGRREKRRLARGFNTQCLTDNAQGFKDRILSLLPDCLHMAPGEIVAREERFSKQREHVALCVARKELGRQYNIEFISDDKTKFVVVDEHGERTLYVGRISPVPVFTVELRKAKLIVDTDEGVIYKGLEKVIFSGKVRYV